MIIQSNLFSFHWNKKRKFNISSVSLVHKQHLTLAIIVPADSLAPNRAWPSGPGISNYTHYNTWDEITYPFLNFNGATVEV